MAVQSDALKVDLTARWTAERWVSCSAAALEFRMAAKSADHLAMKTAVQWGWNSVVPWVLWWVAQKDYRWVARLETSSVDGLVEYLAVRLAGQTVVRWADS